MGLRVETPIEVVVGQSVGQGAETPIKCGAEGGDPNRDLYRAKCGAEGGDPNGCDCRVKCGVGGGDPSKVWG